MVSSGQTGQDTSFGENTAENQGFLDFDVAHLSSFMDDFSRQHIVCVGDLMLDCFVYGDAKRISPEAPVPVLRYNREIKLLGGSGNVVQNIAALGAEVECIGVVGDDAIADEIKALLARDKRIHSSLHVVAGRPTTSKIRYLAGSQQVVRVDREDVGLIDNAIEDKIIDTVSSTLRDGSVLILADYAKGVLTDRLLKEVIALARERGTKVVVEPKSVDFSRYARASVLIANAHEMSAATQMPCGTDVEAHAATRRGKEVGSFDNVITTRSEKGMIALDSAGAMHSFPTKAKEVFDVSGAGDTVNAVVALMLGAGARLEQAAYVANEAAGLVVSKLGTSVTTVNEIKEALHEEDGSNYSDKISELEALCVRVSEVKRSKKSVGFTNGCFDILHVGHLSLLTQARSACDFLIVGVNSDASTKRLKGPERPVNNQHDRALLLAAMELVDAVVIFDEDTPYELIKAIEPNMLMKGADYSIENVVGADVVEKAGGRVLLADLVTGRSTTKTIEKISKSKKH